MTAAWITEDWRAAAASTVLSGSLAAQQDSLPLDSISSRSTNLSACIGYQACVGLHCCLLGWVYVGALADWRVCGRHRTYIAPCKPA